VNHVLGAPAQDAVMLFSVARDGEVERVAARIAVGFEFGRREVVWLGGAEGGESFAHLRRLADALRNPDLREELGRLVERSLGNPEHYRTSVDKTLLPVAAEQFGVRVPRYAIVPSAEEAAAFAARAGYPLAIRRSHGWGGKSVAFAHDAASLVQAFRELEPWTPQPMFPPSLHRVVQRRVLGSTYSYAAAAWRGQLHGGWAARKVVAHPAPTGPATVLQYRSMPELATFSERIVAGFGMSGLFGIEYIVDDEDGSGMRCDCHVSVPVRMARMSHARRPVSCRHPTSGSRRRVSQPVRSRCAPAS
jgi:hypothetical protein